MPSPNRDLYAQMHYSTPGAELRRYSLVRVAVGRRDRLL
jgi:hypothetical protein